MKKMDFYNFNLVTLESAAVTVPAHTHLVKALACIDDFDITTIVKWSMDNSLLSHYFIIIFLL